MTTDDRRTWSEADFENMSWHDNHVHGVHIRSGEFGAGELILDIDYILEWVCVIEGTCQFSIAPATLTFQEATDLRLDLDYAAVTAALVPFSIAQVKREPVVFPTGTATYKWIIEVNWPSGSISFQARGFTQRLRGPALVKSEQWLEPAERAGFEGI